MAKNSTEAPDGLDTFDGDADDPVRLGEAATAAMSDLAGADLNGVQDSLPDTDALRLGFVGVSYDSLDMDLQIGSEVAVVVRGRVVGRSREESGIDHTIRHKAKVKVESVVPYEGK